MGRCNFKGGASNVTATNRDSDDEYREYRAGVEWLKRRGISAQMLTDPSFLATVDKLPSVPAASNSDKPATVAMAITSAGISKRMEIEKYKREHQG